VYGYGAWNNASTLYYYKIKYATFYTFGYIVI